MVHAPLADRVTGVIVFPALVPLASAAIVPVQEIMPLQRFTPEPTTGEEVLVGTPELFRPALEPAPEWLSLPATNPCTMLCHAANWLASDPPPLLWERNEKAEPPEAIRFA